MKSSHSIDAVEKHSSESLLANGNEVDITKNEFEKRFSPLFRQFVGSFSSFSAMLAYGNMVGFSAILLRQLKHEDSEIQINLSEESWIASISTIAMMMACIFCGFAMEKFGRRTLVLMMTPLFFVSWIILCFSVDFYGLLLGRFLTGFCAGFLSPPLSIYICEIAQPSYRGLFLSAQGFTAALGILMPHSLGIILKWNIVAGICALMPLLSCLWMAMVPESPSWLLKKGEIEAAAESFFWFRGQSHDVIEEFEKLVKAQKLSKHQNDSVRLGDLPMLIRTKSFYKPLSILLLFFATLQFAGPNVIASYTITILKKSLCDNMDEYVATIILDVSRVITSALSCIAVKNFGRRPLTTFSGMATAATLISLSLYLHAAAKNEELGRSYGIPMALFTLYIIFITIGINPVAWTVKSELFPLRYRGVGAAMVTFANYTFIFVSVKSTPALFLVLGEQGVLFLFGIFCLIGTILLAMFLPETRNKTLQEIEDSYDSPTENLKTTKTKVLQSSSKIVSSA